MSENVYWDSDSGRVVTTIHETGERISNILAPNGRPYIYKREPIGFKLQSKEKRNVNTD